VIELAHTLLPIVTVPGGASASAGKALFSGNAVGTRSSGDRFDAILKSKTADLAKSDDLVSQIAAMLQSGMPMQSIVDTVAAKLQTLDPSKRTAIARSAHAPPGTAPPPRETVARQVAALVRKARTVPDGVTRGTETVTARQQNDISGKILDASAKELPASAATAPQTTPVDLGSLAQSIVQTVAATLPAGPAIAASVPQAHLTPQKIAPGASGAKADVPAEKAATTPAPDLLSRMLNRAANASARAAGAMPIRLAHPIDLTGTASFSQLVLGIRPPGKETMHDKPVLDGEGPVIAPLPHPVRDEADPLGADPAPPPYTTLDAEAILSQIVKGVGVVAGTNGTHDINLHLQPAQLGDVSLKLSVDGSSVSASVVAQNGDVRAALLNNQHHLSRAFNDAGLKLVSFSVDVSGGDARGFRQDQQSQGFDRRFVVHETTGAIDADASAVADRPTPATASGPLELLNHLA